MVDVSLADAIILYAIWSGRGGDAGTVERATVVARLLAPHGLSEARATPTAAVMTGSVPAAREQAAARRHREIDVCHGRP